MVVPARAAARSGEEATTVPPLVAHPGTWVGLTCGWLDLFDAGTVIALSAPRLRGSTPMPHRCTARDAAVTKPLRGSGLSCRSSAPEVDRRDVDRQSRCRDKRGARGLVYRFNCSTAHPAFECPLPMLLLLICFGCGGAPSETSPIQEGYGGNTGSVCHPKAHPGLVINELSSNNDGNAVDELGNADDWLELANRGSTPIQLDGLVLAAGNNEAALPNEVIDPGQRLLLWADNSPSQGPRHLRVK